MRRVDADQGSSGLVLMAPPDGVPQGRAEPLIVWMAAAVGARLRALGYEQPVELDALAGRWWSIRADLAALGSTSEPGCGYGQTMATTESIAQHFSLYWLEIIAGPFERGDDHSAVYLASRDLDVAWLGQDATVIKVAPWISGSLRDRGIEEPAQLASLAGKYWVCGKGGGFCSTAELEQRLRRDPAAVSITHGPFDREEEAQYAFDVMWESPD